MHINTHSRSNAERWNSKNWLKCCFINSKNWLKFKIGLFYKQTKQSKWEERERERFPP